MTSTKPSKALDGFGERVGATRVEIGVLHALPHRVPGRQHHDFIIAVHLAVRLRVSRRNLLRRKCLDAFAAFTSGSQKPPHAPSPPRRLPTAALIDTFALPMLVVFVLGATDEAEGGCVEKDVSGVVDHVCAPVRTALLCSLLFLIMWFLLGFSCGVITSYSNWHRFSAQSIEEPGSEC